MTRKNLLLLASLWTSVAWAEPWAHVRQRPGAPFPTFHVYSDSATHWDRVGDLEAGLTYRIDARGRCEEGANTQTSSKLRVYSANTEVSAANLAINEDNRSYGPDHGQGWRELTFKGGYAQQQTPSNAKPQDVCNSWLASLASAAPNPQQRRRELLAQGFSRTLENAYTAKFYLACEKKTAAGFVYPSSANDQAAISATLVCHGNPAALDVAGPPARRQKVEQGIEAMRLWVNPGSDATFKGFCPKKLHFGGEIEYQLPPSNNPVNLSYRYVARRGAQVIKSPQYTTTYTQSGKRILHTWPLEFPLASQGAAYEANAAADQPDVYGGSVVLEFVGAVQIHAVLHPVEFDVTCLKKGTVVAPVAGGGQVASPALPPDTLPVPTPPGPAQPTAGTAQLLTKPDLLIRSVIPLAGDGRTLRVRIENQGNAASPRTQLKMLMPGGTKPTHTAVGPIPARGFQVIDVRLPQPVASLRPLRARVDDPSRVPESNESNNSFELAQ